MLSNQINSFLLKKEKKKKKKTEFHLTTFKVPTFQNELCCFLARWLSILLKDFDLNLNFEVQQNLS